VPTAVESDLTLLVRQLRWESEGVVSVVLENADGSALPAWEPGAHVDLHLPGSIVRQYSLCGSPARSRQWRVGVLREENGRGGSAAVHEKVRPGTVIAARGPRNNFVLRPSAAYVFIAGGIGITPILSMVAAAQAAGAQWSLLYGGRSRPSMAFLDELAAYGDRVLIHPQDELGHLPLEQELRDPRPDTLVYCCGPEPLLRAAEAATAAWPLGSLVVERFVPLPVDPAVSANDTMFTVEAAASGITVEVPAGTTIVRALEAVGIFPPVSCEEGICGTCETTVLAGIPDHRDSLLSAAEQAANTTMMICVGRCRGDRLVLDL